jgi:adenosylcobyric acid synthase
MSGIMVVGTTSHAGKSLMTAAICRLLVRQGHNVTPFKGQNMALNAHVTADGGSDALFSVAVACRRFFGFV